MNPEYEALQKEYAAKMDALRAEMKEKAQEYFKAGLKNLFAEHPDLNSFSWTQYTQFWNDGDQCYFSVHAYAESVYVNGENGEEHYLRLEQEGKEYDEAMRLPRAVCDFINTFSNEDMQTMFGDHVEITVNRNEDIATQSYRSHD